MKSKPRPKTELVATRFRDSDIVRLTPNSNDAKEFILENACEYGDLDPLPNNKYALFVRSGYDVQEVLEYFRSYNDI